MFAVPVQVLPRVKGVNDIQSTWPTWVLLLGWDFELGGRLNERSYEIFELYNFFPLPPSGSMFFRQHE